MLPPLAADVYVAAAAAVVYVDAVLPPLQLLLRLLLPPLALLPLLLFLRCHHFRRGVVHLQQAGDVPGDRLGGRCGGGRGGHRHRGRRGRRRCWPLGT